MMLPVRPKPKPNEPLAAYLQRLSAANGHTQPRAFWRAIRRRDQDDLTSLKQALGVTELAMFMAPALPDCRIETEHLELDPGEFNRTVTRWCPACLEQEQWLRPAWGLKTATVCSSHRAMLEDTCPACNTPQPWIRPIVSHCAHCGFDLTRCPIRPAAIYMVKLASELERPFMESAHLSGDLFANAIPLPALVRMIWYLGQFRDRQMPLHPGQIKDCDKLEVAAALFENTAHLLADWPSNFTNMLHVHLTVATASTSIATVFGPLYEVLYKHLGAQEFQFLRKAFEDFLRAEWQGTLTRRHRRFDTSTVDNHGQLPLSQVVKRTGVPQGEIKHMIREGIVEARQRVTGAQRTFTTLSEDDFELVRAKAADYRTLRDISAYLELSDQRVGDLVKGGLLTPEGRTGYSNSGAWRFSFREVADLVNQLQECVTPRTTVVPSLPLAHILKYWRVDQAEFCELIQAVLVREIAASIFIAPSLVSLQIDAEATRQWLALRRSRDYVYAEQAGKHLGEQPKVIYDLVDKALLIAEPVLCGSNRQLRIRWRDMIEFMVRYVSLSALVQHGNGASMTLRTKLKRLGISPVTGPEVDGARKYFYVREQLKAVNWETLECVPDSRFPVDEPAKVDLGRVAGLNQGSLTPGIYEKTAADVLSTDPSFQE